MKRLALSLLVVSCLYSGSYAEHPAWLKIEGRHIKTVTGENFMGVGCAWFPHVMHPTSDEAVREYIKYFKDGGVNTIRLGMQWTKKFADDFTDADFTSRLDNQIATYVDLIRDAGMYVFFDSHEDLAPAWDASRIEVWKKRWVQVAEKFKDNPYVLGYEIMNEPHYWTTNRAGLRNHLIDCIERIREVDTNHIIMIPSDNWTHARYLEDTWGDWLRANGNPDPMEKCLFAIHEYPTDNEASFVAPIIKSFQDEFELPVYLTEFGARQIEYGAFMGQTEEVNRAFETGYFTWCGENTIGWSLWSNRYGYNHVYEDLWMPAAKLYGSPVPADEVIASRHSFPAIMSSFAIARPVVHQRVAHFSRLPSGTIVSIFDATGKLVEFIPAVQGAAQWDMVTAAGIFMYRISNGNSIIENGIIPVR